jgi:cobalt-zinc-cadmium resistance protein CzcA
MSLSNYKRQIITPNCYTFTHPLLSHKIENTMLDHIIQFSINNKLLIGLLTLALIGVGIYQSTQLPIDAVPDITDNQVQVITQAPAYGAEDIERLITFPIEQANSNIAGIKEIRSFSRFGLSLVTIVFDDKIDVYWARQQVSERLQQVQNQIPEGIGTPELGPITTGLGEIYQYVLRPAEGFEHRYDPIALRTIQDWIVRRQLLGVEGVAEVSSFGGKLKQYEINVYPNRLHAFGITIHDVFEALSANNQNTGGAYIEKGPNVLYIRSEGLIKSVDDIKNIVIHTPNDNIPLYIRDVAEVNIGYATRYGALCYNDIGEVAGGIVMMLKGANSSEVIKNVRERIEQVRKTLPEGVIIEPFLDRTKMVNNAISTVEQNLLEGALIVIFVLVLFLGNLRAGLLVASVIPLALLFAICMMNLMGVSGNLMSLGALDFGLIVDGAVIIVEAVMHQIQHNAKNRALLPAEMNQTVSDTSQKMMKSAVFGQMIILIVYLPIFTLQGIEGKMFKPMAQTVAFSLLGAFILSLTYIPMMSALILSRSPHKPTISDRLMAYVEAVYRRTLLLALRFPLAVFVSVLLLFGFTIMQLFSLGGEFIPALEEGDFAVETRVLPGSNLQVSIEAAQHSSKVLMKFPEVEKVVSKIGSGEVPTDPMPIEAQDLMIILKDKSQWTTAHTFDELADTMKRALDEVLGVTYSFQYPVQMRFNELMTGAKQDVVCKIFGENIDTLAKYAEQLGKVIQTIPGAEELFVEQVTGMPQIIISYNRPLIAQYHLSIADINKTVNTALAGQSAGLFFEDEKRFDIMVKLSNDQKRQVADIGNLLIPTPTGLQIPLHQLADVRLKEGTYQIQREDAKRRIIVGFNVGERDVQSIVQELQQKVQQDLVFPSGYYVTYGGAFENLEQAKNRLMIAVPVALLLIFVLLYFAFGNIKQGLLIYTAIPLSTIGGILFLVWRDMPFSISAGVGFIALFGVAVLNGIVLIAEFNRLKSEGIESLSDIVLLGTQLRLRPVLMTAFVASLGFLPMALSHGAGAEVQRPLATVVIGGLLVATFLTLIVLPLLYIIAEKGIKGITRRRSMGVFVLVVACCGNHIQAQQTIDLAAAQDLAVKNSVWVKNELLKAEYAKALIDASKRIPNTAIAIEMGQVNSVFFDTKISISQSLSLPIVYQRQKELKIAEYEALAANTHLQEWELRRAVSDCYTEYCYLKNKEQLLYTTDTLLTNFYQRAAIRWQQGETNILEKTFADNERAAIRLQIAQLKQDLLVTQLSFQYLLNSTDKLLPNYIAYNQQATAATPPSYPTNTHPQLLALQHQIKIIGAEQALAKAQLKPELSVGLNNSSFRGIGPNDKYYSFWNRFTSLQLGTSIPLLGKKQQKAAIDAYSLAQKSIEHTINLQQDYLANQRAQKEQSLVAAQNTVNYYAKEGRKNAQLISTTAQKQYAAGEINYLEMATLLRQTVDIYLAQLEAVHQWHIINNQLHFLTIKP